MEFDEKSYMTGKLIRPAQSEGQVDRLLTAIKDYRCLHAQDEEGNGLPLVDLIANGLGDNDIKRAVEEVEALHDFISGELW